MAGRYDPEKLIADMNSRVGLPGMVDSWGYPIKIRLDMLTTGIRTPVGIKFQVMIWEILINLQSLLKKKSKLFQARSAIADRVVGGKYIEIIPNRHDMARYGLSMANVNLLSRVH